jgi:septum formation protein
MSAQLYLASQSPRRQELLRQLGVSFELLLPDASEDAEALEVRLGQEPAKTYVHRVCLLKTQAALQRLQRQQKPARPVLCADTTVALGNTLLGKPDHSEQAAHMLRLLSGTKHRVLTAVCVATPEQSACLIKVSHVSFTALSEDEIQAYIASGEPFGKAGAYGIQGRAGAFIRHLSGSYSGVMGLPLYETRCLLNEIGITA